MVITITLSAHSHHLILSFYSRNTFTLSSRIAPTFSLVRLIVISMPVVPLSHGKLTDDDCTTVLIDLLLSALHTLV